MRLEDKYNQSNLIELEDLFKGPVTTDVSFWGSRIVTVQGYEGSLNIHDLGIDLIGIAKSGDRNLSHQEKSAGVGLTFRLQIFYRETDGKGNFLARIFMYIREFSFFNPYTVRFFIEEGNLY